MFCYNHDMNDVQELKNKIFVEPISKDVRPALIRYVKQQSRVAKELSSDALLSSEGSSIAGDICAAIAWQDAEGVQNDGWFNGEDEPTLHELLGVSGILDADGNHPDIWEKLFSLAEKLA